MLLGHHLFWVTDEFLFAMLVAQIGTMKCFYCPQKDVSLVPWNLLSPPDQTFLQDKYSDAERPVVTSGKKFRTVGSRIGTNDLLFSSPVHIPLE